MRSLGHTDHFVAGSIGEPGQRTFLIEVGGDGAVEWFLVEKEQVAALARRSLELLREMGEAPPGPGPDLTEPGEPTFRVAEIGIGREADVFVIVLSPVDGTDAEPVAVTLGAGRLGAMAVRALEVVVAGRPACELCGLPKDPRGHACPASNGDRRRR
jgi:uncharacterized repeat protein (TIGR03847 family)